MSSIPDLSFDLSNVIFSTVFSLVNMIIRAGLDGAGKTTILHRIKDGTTRKSVSPTEGQIGN